MSFEGQDGFCAKKGDENLALGEVRAEMSAMKALARKGKGRSPQVWRKRSGGEI